MVVGHGGEGIIIGLLRHPVEAGVGRLPQTHPVGEDFRVVEVARRVFKREIDWGRGAGVERHRRLQG